MLNMIYYFFVGISIVSALFFYPLITSILLLLLQVIIVQEIPLNLAWSREFFSRLMCRFLFNSIFTIFIFAYLYYQKGVLVSGNAVKISFFDSIYFSITTWTTLGYGDFAPLPELRLVTSLEAINGYFSSGLFIGFIILWVTEAIRSGDEYVSCIKRKANQAQLDDTKNRQEKA